MIYPGKKNDQTPTNGTHTHPPQKQETTNKPRKQAT